MLKMFKYFRAPDWIRLGCIAAILIGQSWIDLQLPRYSGVAIDLLKGDIASDNLVRDIWINGGFMLAFAFASMSLMFCVGFLSAHLGASVGKTLRQKIFYKVESFSLSELGGFSTASLITRTTNDVQNVTMAVTMGFRFLIKAPVMLIIAVIQAVNLSGQLTLVVAAGVFLIALLMVILIIVVMPYFKRIQKLIDKVNGSMRENLMGLRVVRAYNAESYQEGKFEDANKKLTKSGLFVHRVMAIMEPFMNYIMNMVTLAVYWLGAFLLVSGGLTKASVIVEFGMYATAIIMSFLFLVMLFMFIPRAAVSAKRINEVLDKPLVITDGEGAEPVDNGTVKFKNVYFRYPDAEEDVLTDISFTVEKGQTVAFIGSTGSGKSTLIKLIPRFFDATRGKVLVGGVPVGQYTQKQLRDQIGYVPQKGVLFSGTIRDNIVYGDTVATDEEMATAARIARAEDFIEERAEKYDSSIAQGGTNVSGGQKQRLSIARALVKNPDILVFDDSFSALDFKTDRELRTALKASTTATCLIVAQRIGTVLHADKIVVLDSGRVVGVGTHKELMQTCGVYREIAFSQLAKEELE